MYTLFPNNIKVNKISPKTNDFFNINRSIHFRKEYQGASTGCNKKYMIPF